MPLDPVLVRGLTPISMPQPDPNAGMNQLGAIMKIQGLQNEMQANQLQAQKYQQDVAASQATERRAVAETKWKQFQQAVNVAGDNSDLLIGTLQRGLQDPDIKPFLGDLTPQHVELIRSNLTSPENIQKLRWRLTGGYTPEVEMNMNKSPTTLGQLQQLRDRLDRTDPMYSTKLDEVNRQIAHEQTRSPGTRVEINSSDTAETQAAKSFMADIAEARKTLRNTPAQIENLEAAKQLVLNSKAKDFMGPGGDAFRTAASFFNNRLGANINVEGVTDASELKSRLFRGILDNLKKMDPNPTERQQAALSEAIGSLGTDPLALPRILDTFIETSRRQVEMYNEDVKSAEDRGVAFPFNPYIKLPPRASSTGTAPATTPAAAAAPTAPAAAGASSIPEGQTATSADGKTRIIFRGGQWHLMQ